MDVECYDSDADYSDPDRWQHTFVIDRNAPNFTKAWAETFPANVYCDAADSGSGGFFPQTPIEKQFLAGPDGLSKYTAPVAYAQCVEHGTDSSLNPSWPVDPVSEEQSGGFDNALLLCPAHPDASAWRQVEEDARSAEQAERERQRLIDEGLAFEDGLYRVGEEIQPGTYADRIVCRSELHSPAEPFVPPVSSCPGSDVGGSLAILVPRRTPAVPRPEDRQADQAWRRLREMRSDPPLTETIHDRPQRRKLFSAALEQSEQFLRGAKSADLPVRPVLAFYSLSQGFRAISALHSGRDWRVGGHGLTENLDSRPRRIGHLEITRKTGGSDTLNRVASLMGESLEDRYESTSLRQVWASTPELRFLPLAPEDADTHPALDVELRSRKGQNDVSVRVFGLPQTAGKDVPHLIQWLEKNYPGSETLSSSGAAAEQSTSEPWTWIVRGITASVDPTPRPFHSYWTGECWLMPSIGAAPKGTNPALLWYMVLHALSMRARYSPETWLKDIDVDESTDGVRLADCLDISLRVVPVLLEYVIRVVTDPTSSNSEE